MSLHALPATLTSADASTLGPTLAAALAQVPPALKAVANATGEEAVGLKRLLRLLKSQVGAL